VWLARAGLIVLGAFAAWTTTMSFSFAHYTACAIGLVVLVAVDGLRRVLVDRGAHARRLFALVVLPLSAPVVLAWHVAFVHTEPGPHDWSRQRAALAREWASDGRRHLALVRYDADHDPNGEWVYDGADLDEQPVVWARDLDATTTGAVLDHFPERVAHLVVVHTSGRIDVATIVRR
jgi:hypothetical protein